VVAQVTPLVDVLAAERVTRLVTRDTLTAPLRRRLRRAADSGQLPSWPDELARCSWCVSIWAAAAVVAARRLAPRAWAPIALVLAGSQAIGWLEHECDQRAWRPWEDD